MSNKNKTQNKAQGNKKNKPSKEEAKRIFLENTMKNISKNLPNGIFKATRDKVAFILCKYQEARNSDRRLYILLIKKFYPSYVTPDGKVSLKSTEVPMPGGILRWRAIIQNQLKLFRADPDVRARRGTLEDEAEVEFGHHQDTDWLFS